MILWLPAANLMESGVRQNIQASYTPCNSYRLLYCEHLAHALPDQWFETTNKKQENILDFTKSQKPKRLHP